MRRRSVRLEIVGCRTGEAPPKAAALHIVVIIIIVIIFGGGAETLGSDAQRVRCPKNTPSRDAADGAACIINHGTYVYMNPD